MTGRYRPGTTGTGPEPSTGATGQHFNPADLRTFNRPGPYRFTPPPRFSSTSGATTPPSCPTLSTVRPSRPRTWPLGRRSAEDRAMRAPGDLFACPYPAVLDTGRSEQLSEPDRPARPAAESCQIAAGDHHQRHTSRVPCSRTGRWLRPWHDGHAWTGHGWADA